MLGALTRARWLTERLDSLSRHMSGCVSVIVSIIKKLPQDTIEESTMLKRQSGGAHRDCTPSESYTVQDLLIIHKVKALVHLNEKHFKRYAAKSSLCSSATRNLIPVHSLPTVQVRLPAGRQDRPTPKIERMRGAGHVLAVGGHACSRYSLHYNADRIRIKMPSGIAIFGKHSVADASARRYTTLSRR
ncbi:hypothetical protein N657DRAFT_91046 [Parathielavia appendiculata]|uniref:Uncharacterized protein n=1 Tax=Parathielavia appendiculata TaxID=2587402 RepID=A0AAN6UAY6_9PEZI|nr:hypothetical protein N657DRAFT_91046 [Parathielavia appendiculata]